MGAEVPVNVEDPQEESEQDACCHTWRQISLWVLNCILFHHTRHAHCPWMLMIAIGEFIISISALVLTILFILTSPIWALLALFGMLFVAFYIDVKACRDKLISSQV